MKFKKMIKDAKTLEIESSIIYLAIAIDEIKSKDKRSRKILAQLQIIAGRLNQDRVRRALKLPK